MGKTYEMADGQMHAMVREAMVRWHRALRISGVTVDVLWIREFSEDGELMRALEHQGYPAAATIAIVSLKQRALGQADALLVIDEAVWRDMSEPERWALLDHELTHLAVVAEGGGEVTVHPETGELLGEPKEDDLGRPKLRIRKHDVQIGGFRDVMQRHRQNALEVQAVEACRDLSGQYFWSFAKTADEELREAVGTILDPDGTGATKVSVRTMEGREVTFDAAAGKRLRDAGAGRRSRQHEASPAE